METVNQIDQIQAKLRKLVKLQEGAMKIGSENEANAAAAAIQRLLLQYNLSMEEIDMKDKPKDEVNEEFGTWYKYKFIGGDWEYRLMHVICKWNFCKCFIHGDRKDKRMLFLGTKQNMETVKWLHGMLCERFVEIGKKKYKEHQESIAYRFKPIGLDTYLRSYLTGCAAGLDEKMRLEAKEEKKDEVLATKITALVVRHEQAVDEFIAQKYHFTKERRQTTKMDSAFFSGVDVGRNASINKAVGDSKREQANNVNILK